jgi:Pentapeptide repeats (8 copies)
VENEARKTLAQIMGGAAVLVGLYFTWSSLEVSREGQVTERFTKAIDQLGAVNDKGEKQLELRLGGIYALERIARDSARDHWPIIEVLTTYVREHAPWPPKPPKDTPPPQDKSSLTGDPAAAQGQSPPKLATDIQAILTVLGRRTLTYGNGEEQPLDLRGTDLHGADLEEAILEYANLRGAHLEGARLQSVYLQGAELRGAHLEGAHLGGAYLEGASLRRARLEKANFWGAHLAGAKNLTVEQLSTVKTLYQAHLDPPLLEQIQQQYPQLLEKP